MEVDIIHNSTMLDDYKKLLMNSVAIFSTYHNCNGYKTKTLQFFKIPPESEKVIKKVHGEVSRELNCLTEVGYKFGFVSRFCIDDSSGADNDIRHKAY